MKAFSLPSNPTNALIASDVETLYRSKGFFETKTGKAATGIAVLLGLGTSSAIAAGSVMSGKAARDQAQRNAT